MRWGEWVWGGWVPYTYHPTHALLMAERIFQSHIYLLLTTYRFCTDIHPN